MFRAPSKKKGISKANLHLSLQQTEFPFYFEKKLVLVISFITTILPICVFSAFIVKKWQKYLIKYLFNYCTTVLFHWEASIHGHIFALKNAGLCSVHFNSQQVHTILATWPTFYKPSELSFTPLHIQNLNMLKQNSTGEVPKNESAKKILPKQSSTRPD